MCWRCESFAENAASGFGSREAGLHWSQKTITARDRASREIIGVIVWEKLEAVRTAWVCVGYVEPAFRRRGVYNAMFERLVEIAKRENLRSVSGGVAVGNEAMRTVAERQGRTATFVTYSREIE